MEQLMMQSVRLTCQITLLIWIKTKKGNMSFCNCKIMNIFGQKLEIDHVNILMYIDWAKNDLGSVQKGIPHLSIPVSSMRQFYYVFKS